MGDKRRSRDSGNVMVAVWLIGLGILWMFDMWWPGILILIGVSMLVRGMLPARPREKVAARMEDRESAAADKMDDEDTKPDEWEDEESETPAFMLDDTGEKEWQRADLLPTACPECGGPVAENAHKVEWFGPEAAKCPFCDTGLTLKKI